MDIVLMAEASEEFAGYLSEVTDSELTAETPCVPWTIEDLYHHMIEENIALGQTINPRSQPPKRMEGTLRETVYRASARYAMDTLAAVADPSPELRDRFDLHLANTVIHTWDLATAIEFDFELPSPRTIETARECMCRIAPSERGTGKAFADIEEFPTSSAMEEVLTRSGRSPAWRARLGSARPSARDQ